MSNRITFDIPRFRQRFPMFADETLFPDALLQGYFDTATCYVDNTRGGCLSDTCRELALWAMTAHLCRLFQLIGQGKTPGVTTSATVGSVSVSTTPPPFGTSEWSYWLSTTPYGQMLISLLAGQVAGGLYLNGRPERSAFRKVGGRF